MVILTRSKQICILRFTKTFMLQNNIFQFWEKDLGDFEKISLWCGPHDKLQSIFRGGKTSQSHMAFVENCDPILISIALNASFLWFV
jgi:hypothetical protein